MGERNAFLANPKLQDCVSQWGEHDCSAITKRMVITISTQVCLISEINFNFKKNGGMKSFSCKSTVSISCNPMGRT